MKLIILAVVCLVIILNGCGRPPVPQTIIRAHPIDAPDPPRNFAVKEPGKPTPDGKEWIEVHTLQPKQYWRAYSDGAVVLKPSEWRVLITTRNNVEKWIEDVQGRLKRHNDLVKDIAPDIVKLPERKPWYKFW